jgi:membrane fusion protein, multidrug efflux system
VASDKAQVVEAHAQVNAYEALYQSIQAQVNEQNANVQTAELNQSYTNVYAPLDGRVTNKAVQVGNYVQVGQSLLAIVPDHVHVTANFKESQIGLMRPGQPVEIDIDALHRKFDGHVDSLQAGSGAAFSLLPPENATGNYVKVVQRVPVKIEFDRPLTDTMGEAASANKSKENGLKPVDVGIPLGPGESVVPTVKVQDFRYGPLGLAVIGAVMLVLLVLVYRWGTRPAKSKAAE